MSDELSVYPVADAITGTMIQLFLIKKDLDTQLLVSSIYVTVLLCGFFAIIIPRYRFDTSIKIYLPLYLLVAIIIIQKQYNYYSPQIEEITRLIKSLHT